MITRRPWFGPKRHFGWGWSPASWQGWVVTAAFLVCIVGCQYYFKRPWPSGASAIACLVIFLGVVMLTGTKPGGPNSK